MPLRHPFPVCLSSTSFKCECASLAVIRVLTFSAQHGTAVWSCAAPCNCVRFSFVLSFAVFPPPHHMSSPHACTARVTTMQFGSRMPKEWLPGTRGWGGCAGIQFVSIFPSSIVCFYQSKGVLATRTLRGPAILHRLLLCHTTTSGGSSRCGGAGAQL